MESRGAELSITDDIEEEESKQNTNLNIKKFILLVKKIEYDSIKISDLNLRIGFPSNLEIEAGSKESIYVEVTDPNSLIYIGFATTLNDITFHILKFSKENNLKQKEFSPPSNKTEEEEDIPDKGHFRYLFKIDKIDSSIQPIKFVFFAKEPGTYKIIWDNSYSWFTSKTLKYRLSVLKPISQIDLERKVDFGKLKNQMNLKEENENENEGNEPSNKISISGGEGERK